VQRTVDNDKRESGGIRAATASDYFHRFPSLFPFLLSGEFTCCIINVSCV
jgi:hypothetical protein